MSVLGCLAAIFLIGFFVVFGFLSTILNAIMSLFGFNTRQRTTLQDGATDNIPKEEPQKKVIPDDEGEYVDFEEV